MTAQTPRHRPPARSGAGADTSSQLPFERKKSSSVISPRITSGSSITTLVLSSTIAAGVQFGWALQLSLLTPYLQTLGIEHTFTSFIWLCGPITGLLVQPCVGVWSDKCTLKLGRRRPFILAGSFLICVAVTIIGYAADIGYLLGDSTNNCTDTNVKRPWAAFIFILGFWILDVANNTVQGPARALLADLAGPDQHDTANAVFCLWMAIGNILGFSVGSSDKWHSIFPFVITKACCNACGDLKAGFLIAVVFLLFALLVSMVFARETPLLAENITGMEDASPLLLEQPDDMESLKRTKVLPRNDANEPAGKNAGTGVVKLVKNVRLLPSEMTNVLTVMTLCWLSWFPFFLFDMDWMGREIFQGDPFGDKEKFIAYENGVRKGAFGLLLNSIVLAIGSFLIDPLCCRFGAKVVWSISNFMICICMATTTVISTVAAARENDEFYSQYATWAKHAAVATFAVLGLPLAVTYSVPYSITAGLTSDSGSGQGLAMGVLNLAVVLPQMVIAIGAGPWDALFGGGNEPAFWLASLFALVAGFFALMKLPEKTTYISTSPNHGFG